MFGDGVGIAIRSAQAVVLLACVSVRPGTSRPEAPAAVCGRQSRGTGLATDNSMEGISNRHLQVSAIILIIFVAMSVLARRARIVNGVAGAGAVVFLVSGGAGATPR